MQNKRGIQIFFFFHRVGAKPLMLNVWYNLTSRRPMWIECCKQREEQSEMCWKARAFADLEMNFGFYSDQDREPLEGFIMKNDVI